MAILVLAGVLSVPSVVFAEANWYGSLRAGVMSSDSNTKVFDGGSRWGIRGSHEAGEGLSAIYRFEHKMSTENAGLDGGGRLAYVGLSGGFGTVTAGQIWSAAYNSVGAVTDNSWFWGDSQTSYRHGNVISYAFSNDLMALQADVQYAAVQARDPGMNDLQKSEFGLTVNVGDIGKVALAHTTQKFVLTVVGEDEGDSSSDDTGAEVKTNSVAGEVSVAGLRVYVGTQTKKSTFVAPTGGASTGDDTEQKTTFFGFGGGLGDTGLSYVFQWRDVKDSHKPWLLSLTKGLGDSAALVIEHANHDDADPNQTGIALAVHF